MKIFIDPGHGGKDNGVVGLRGTKESGLTLEIAFLLKDLLAEKGHKVILSREKDSYVSLVERANKANKNKADFFISLHFNGMAGSDMNGTTTYFCPGNKTGEKAATNILNGVSQALNTKKIGVKAENFAVLRMTNMPAVLVEIAYLTNAAEEEKMKIKENIFLVAERIAETIDSILK